MDIWNRIKENYLFIVLVVLLLLGLSIWIIINNKDNIEGFDQIPEGKTRIKIRMQTVLGDDINKELAHNIYLSSKEAAFCPHLLSHFTGKEETSDSKGEDLHAILSNVVNVDYKEVEEVSNETVFTVWKSNNKIYLRNHSGEFLQAYYPSHQNINLDDFKKKPVVSFNTKNKKEAATLTFTKKKDNVYTLAITQPVVEFRENVAGGFSGYLALCCPTNECFDFLRCKNAGTPYDRLCAVVDSNDAIYFKISKYDPPVQPVSIEPEITPATQEQPQEQTQEQATETNNAQIPEVPVLPITETNNETGNNTVEPFINISGYNSPNISSYNSPNAPNGSTKLTEGFSPLGYSKIYY